MGQPQAEPVWKKVLTIVALAATVLAIYLQAFERGARREEARLAAVRLEEAIARSRARLRTEIVAELRAELRRESAAAPSGSKPVPDTVLRRLETGATGQALGAFQPDEAQVLANLNESVESLSREVEEADNALRRDLEELRAATLREEEVSSRIMILLTVALACLIGRLLPSLRPGGHGVRQEREDGLS
ncbi:MAG: hypothetical protein ABUT39_10375 [Acidobacteriota bacterium]